MNSNDYSRDTTFQEWVLVNDLRALPPFLIDVGGKTERSYFYTLGIYQCNEFNVCLEKKGGLEKYHLKKLYYENLYLKNRVKTFKNQN